MASEREPETDLLAPAAARLTARYGHLVGTETIRRILDETYRTLLANATVTNFLPVLAERSAAIALARTANRQLADGPEPIQPTTATPTIEVLRSQQVGLPAAGGFAGSCDPAVWGP